MLLGPCFCRLFATLRTTLAHTIKQVQKLRLNSLLFATIDAIARAWWLRRVVCVPQLSITELNRDFWGIIGALFIAFLTPLAPTIKQEQKL